MHRNSWSFHMFRTLPLFFLLTGTLLPSSSHVDFNTGSVLEGKNHSSRGTTTTVTIVDKDSNRRHLKVGYVFMARHDRKNCSRNLVTRSRGSDGDSGKVAKVIYSSMKLSLASSANVTTVCSKGQSCHDNPTSSHLTPPPFSLQGQSGPPTSPPRNSSSPPPPPPFLVQRQFGPPSPPPPFSVQQQSRPPPPLPSPLIRRQSSPPPPSSIVNFLLPPSPSPRRSSPFPRPIYLSPAPTPRPTPRPIFLSKPHPIDNDQTWKMKVIVGVTSAIMGALCIIFCCFRYKSLTKLVKFCLTTKSNPNIEVFLTTHGAVAQKRYKFSEVKKMTNSFKVKLGQGGFGAVYKGKLPSGYPVAVKLLNASKGNGEDFINEIASISRTSHVNVVTLLGFCLEGRKKALIYEYMANGSLDKFIYNRGPETVASLSWENLYQISVGIARGLEYLHRGCNTRILHFDIKPHNILLDQSFCPKISDFGLAKLCPKKESIVSMSDTRGTIGYVAPEMCNRHFGGVSHKSDVYSYGMLLLEMVGGRKNINADASHTSEIYFPHLVYRRLELDNDVRPDEVMTTEENEIAKRMTIVGLWCIQTFPNDRPIMSRVVDMLEGNMNSLEMPPKPLLSSPTRSVTESSS